MRVCGRACASRELRQLPRATGAGPGGSVAQRAHRGEDRWVPAVGWAKYGDTARHEAPSRAASVDAGCSPAAALLAQGGGCNTSSRPRLRRWWHVGQLCQVAWGVWARGRGDTPRQPLVRQGKATSCGNCPHLAPVTRCSARGQTATIGALLVAWARWEKRGDGPQSARPPDKRARGPLQAGRIPEAAPPLRPSK